MSTHEAERKSLVVEQTFLIAKLGLIVEPGPPFATFTPAKNHRTCEVRIVRPGGTEFVAQASFYVAHFSPWQAQPRYLEAGRYTCALQGVNKDDVPVGSTIYL